MQFVIIGLDGTDQEAPARRQAVRQDHIAMGDKLLEHARPVAVQSLRGMVSG